MSKLSPEQAADIPARLLAQLCAEDLFHLRHEAEDQLAKAGLYVQHIQRALDMRYCGRAEAERRAEGVDSGVVVFSDGNVRVTAESDKTVSWDQSILNEIAARLMRQGENPFRYIDAHFSINEARYRDWTTEQQYSFARARIVTLKDPRYRLALLPQDGAP